MPVLDLHRPGLAEIVSGMCSNDSALAQSLYRADLYVFVSLPHLYRTAFVRDRTSRWNKSCIVLVFALTYFVLDRFLYGLILNNRENICTVPSLYGSAFLSRYMLCTGTFVIRARVLDLERDKMFPHQSPLARK